jgi:small subunit ribosomal protein S18
MARDRDRDRERRRTPKDSNRRVKKKICIFCKEHVDWVDYKDVNVLRRFMSDRGKIRARRVSGNCSQHQRDVAIAIKTARELALLPYTQRAINERAPGRGRGPRDGGGGGGGGGGRGGYPPAAPVDAEPDADADVLALDVDVDIDDEADEETP